MGIRQTLNENPIISGAIIGVCILIACVVIIGEFVGGHGGRHGFAKAFFSDDDGKTWFVDNANKITPFTDSNGKTAVQAVVYQCKDGKSFVAYLMEFTKEGKERAEQIRSGVGPTHATGGRVIGNEVKKPGAATWVKFDPKDPAAYTSVMTPVCPDGGVEGLRIVLPNR